MNRRDRLISSRQKNGEQQALRMADDGWRMASGKRKGVEGFPADYSLGRLGCKNDRQTVADGQRATLVRGRGGGGVA